jgi:hypothetical protein
VGEDAVLADLRAHPPDVVALVDRPFGGMGVGPFGEDPRNGAGLMAFVRERYEPVRRIGGEPFQGRGFGVVLLQRRASAATAQGPPPAHTSP